MASATVTEITRRDLQDLPTPPVASITNVKHLSSYNWIEASKPTIAVPGSPPLWSPPSTPRTLEKDSGLVYIDQNEARLPASPLEPLFRALYITNPTFDIRAIDVVTDRNNIRKLLSFINPRTSQGGSQAFTIEVEVTGNTALFSRKETSTQEFIEPHDFRGFGHAFEKEYTTDKIEGSTGHHRIISYRFGDLDLIVRHELDGYLPDGSTPASNTNQQENDDLSSTLASLSISSASPLTAATSSGSSLAIRNEGQAVPRQSTFVIKTRVSHKSLEIQEVAAQLWISQTPNLVRAFHDKGKFRQPVVQNVVGAVNEWEQANQHDLKKLSALISNIVNIVKGYGGRAIIKYNPYADKLVVTRQEDGGEMLPKDLYSKWAKDDVPKKENATAASRDPVDMSKVKILIGSTEYLVDTNRIPHFKSYANSQQYSDGNAVPMQLKEYIPFFDIIHQGVRDGFRQFFRRMPTQLSEYRSLCETLKFLQIDVLVSRNLRDIMSDMRKGKSDWDYEDRQEIGGQKSLARDSAFRLLYGFLTGEFDARDMAYNATSFVVSHPGIFRCRTRLMVRRAYEDRFPISDKQRKVLDKWPIDDPSGERSDDDATTEVDDYYYDSDYSF
ncbi:hypothetical protein F4821DRAFT_244465 [Hypoxylon rubiginosum]|uniref:Uncharacterized protein n=1 Tax=Hypoxylon rubiginosum TaxID=110542 RepID=A0ACC0CT88_9PEZI|nr:hypothetical protein F4821DRAFT_244465 [Hypoxylon rubiginosum]